MSDKPESKKPVWMLLEDDESLRDLLSTMFDLWDYEALVFSNGYHAMKWLDKVNAGKYKEKLPELALMDIRVPGPHGHEVAARIREVSAVADMPVVLMTAFRVDAVERAEIERVAKPDVFLTKPLFPPDELKKFLVDTIKKKQAEVAAKADKAKEQKKEPEKKPKKKTMAEKVLDPAVVKKAKPGGKKKEKKEAKKAAPSEKK